MTDGGAPGETAQMRLDEARARIATLERRLAETEERLTRDLREKSDEIERARAAAELASRAKTVFLANMSHEIRTPLSSVMGYANLIATAEAASPTTLMWAQRLQRSAEHLLALLDDVLDMAKIEAGKLDLHLVESDPTVVLEEVGVLMEPRAVERGIALEVTVDTELPARLCTDPLRLKQILVNLVGNAIKYTPSGEVAVRARQRMSPVGRTYERRLEIEVVDTGVGIAEGDLDLLFKPFEQARSRPREGGVGLGLDIARRMARLLGGDITVVSELGVGSTFTLTLPMDAGADRGTTPARLVTRSGLMTDAPRAPRLDGRVVLVVDDGEDNRTILSHFLRQAGAVPLEAVSLAEAEAVLVGPRRVEVVVTDLQLADGDGLTLVRRMAERGDYRPVLVLTADAMVETRARALAAGVADFLVKPVVAWRLVSRIAALPARVTPRAEVTVERARPAERVGARTPSRPALKRVPTTPTGEPLGWEPERRDPQRVPTAPSARPLVPEVLTSAERLGPDTSRNRRPVRDEEVDRPDVPDELIERFYALLAERVYGLEEGLSAREPARLRDIGHRIAGSGATMGHPELTEFGRSLERTVLNGAAWPEVEARAQGLLAVAREAVARRRWSPR